MSNSYLVVFTGRPPSQIIAENGTQAWALDAKRARRAKYVICTQNQQTYEFFHPTEPHASAFLVGKISDVVLSDEQSDEVGAPPRHLIVIDEFARINVPNVWKGWRNPVRYLTSEELGFDPGALDFEPMPDKGVEVSVRNALSDAEPKYLTIAEAKQGLAATFGVPIEAIEITVRG